MTAKPEDFLLQAWKQQLDLGLRLVETLVEGSTKLREMRIEAARASAEKCAAYWRELYEVAARASRTAVHPPAATPKFDRIPVGKLAEERTGAELPRAPVKTKPSRRAHAQGAQ